MSLFDDPEPVISYDIEGHKEEKFLIELCGKQVLHRSTGPAYTTYDMESWWFYGIRHRMDGPAITWASGHQEWWVKGQLHREDGPAIIHRDTTLCWYFHGQIHRDDGPAVIDADGTKKWVWKNQRHRLDGPAIEFADGTGVWYFKGLKMEVSSQQEFERMISLRAFW